jgi:hypothetical protein
MDLSKLENNKRKPKDTPIKDEPPKQAELNKDQEKTDEVESFKLTGQPRQLSLKDL